MRCRPRTRVNLNCASIGQWVFRILSACVRQMIHSTVLVCCRLWASSRLSVLTRPRYEMSGRPLSYNLLVDAPRMTLIAASICLRL